MIFERTLVYSLYTRCIVCMCKPAYQEARHSATVFNGWCWAHCRMVDVGTSLNGVGGMGAGSSKFKAF